MNHPFSIECARRLAHRPDVAAEKDVAGRVTRLYRLLYGRTPKTEELRLAEEYLGAGGDGAWETLRAGATDVERVRVHRLEYTVVCSPITLRDLRCHHHFPEWTRFWRAALWMSVHTQLSVEIARQLTPKLLPRYAALTPERFVFDTFEDVGISQGIMLPDVGVLRSDVPGPSPSGPAILEAPLKLATEMPTAIPHVTIEIRDTSNRELVTVIEVLSPTNKRGEGRVEYLVKRRRVLLSAAHLLEIDLLRAGQRVPMRQALPPAPYFIFLSREPRRPLTEVWPIQLDQPLPTVPVPLRGDDPDVSLDLQKAIGEVYDTFGYAVLTDYTRPPEPPLAPEQLAWINDRLQPLRVQRQPPASATGGSPNGG